MMLESSQRPSILAVVVAVVIVLLIWFSGRNISKDIIVSTDHQQQRRPFTAANKKIAVCIHGELDHLNLESSFQHLFSSSNNIDVQFTLFYSLLQSSASTTSSTSSASSSGGCSMISSSSFANCTSKELIAHLRNRYLLEPMMSSNNDSLIQLGNVNIREPWTQDKWEQLLHFKLSPSDSSLSSSNHLLFTQKKLRSSSSSALTLTSILNRYRNEVECARTIIQYEHQQQQKQSKSQEDWKFDYIISMREDLYFFEDIHLKKDLLRNYFEFEPIVEESEKSSKLRSQSTSQQDQLHHHHQEKTHFPILDDKTLFTSSRLFEDYAEYSRSSLHQNGLQSMTKYTKPNIVYPHHLHRHKGEDNNAASTSIATININGSIHNVTITRTTNNKLHYNSNYNKHNNQNLSTVCHFLSQHCLNRFGVNNRFQLFDRITGLFSLQSRISYIKYLLDRHLQVYNPEQLELTQLQNLYRNICEIDSIDQLPVTIAQWKKVSGNNSTGNSVCFPKDELHKGNDHCYPAKQRDFVLTNVCN